MEKNRKRRSTAKCTSPIVVVEEEKEYKSEREEVWSILQITMRYMRRVTGGMNERAMSIYMVMDGAPNKLSSFM